MNIIKALSGVSAMLKGLPNIEEARKDIFRDEIDEVIIDTVCAFDTNKWETGINIKGDWIIVEIYDNKKQAKTGHEKYVSEVKNGKRDFKDNDMWGLKE